MKQAQLDFVAKNDGTVYFIGMKNVLSRNEIEKKLGKKKAHIYFHSGVTFGKKENEDTIIVYPTTGTPYGILVGKIYPRKDWYDFLHIARDAGERFHKMLKKGGKKVTFNV